MIAGVILAAGASRRLGRPKQLLPLGGRPLADWPLAALREFGPAQIVLVVGHEAGAVQAALDLRGVTVVHNPRYAEGQSTSLQAGLGALDAGIEAAVIVTCDQPLISAAALRELVAAFERTALPLVATDYGDHLGVPLLIARSMWPAALAIRGDQGARALLRDNPDRFAAVRNEAPEAAIDVDTDEHYNEVRRVVEALDS